MCATNFAPETLHENFLIAAKSGNLDEFTPFLQISDLNLEYTDKDGCTALVLASTEGHLSIVQALIEHGADMYAANNTGWNSFMMACAYGHYAIVEYFIEVGMNINLHNENGCTAIMMGCVRGHVPIVKRLLASGVEFEAVNKTFHNALLVSAWYGHCYLTMILLTCGANINSATIEKKTSLMLAVEYGHVLTVLLLLEKGADAFLQDKDGKTVYELTNNDDEQIRDILLFHLIKQLDKLTVPMKQRLANLSTIDENQKKELEEGYTRQLDRLNAELKYWENLAPEEFAGINMTEELI